MTYRLRHSATAYQRAFSRGYISTMCVFFSFHRQRCSSILSLSACMSLCSLITGRFGSYESHCKRLLPERCFGWSFRAGNVVNCWSLDFCFMHPKRRWRKKYAEISITMTSECDTMKFTHSMCICCSAVSSIVIIAAASYTRVVRSQRAVGGSRIICCSHTKLDKAVPRQHKYLKKTNSIHTFDVRALSRATGSGSGLSSDSTISCFRNQRLRCGRFAEA